jgi:hypothetical protein
VPLDHWIERSGITTPIEFQGGPALIVTSLVILPSAIGPFSALISSAGPFCEMENVGAWHCAGSGLHRYVPARLGPLPCACPGPGGTNAASVATIMTDSEVFGIGSSFLLQVVDLCR